MAYRWTKKELYSQASIVRQWFGLTSFPVDSFTLAHIACDNLHLEKIPFTGGKIAGMLSIGEKTVSIAVNANHSKNVQNFYCMHEVLHYLWHKNFKPPRTCYEAPSNHNTFSEWQANEGSAELLVPYRQFIPEYVSFCNTALGKTFGVDKAKKFFSEKFGVSEQVVKNRVESLKYEIYQYRNGVPIENVEVLSMTKQEQRGILIKSDSEIERARDTDTFIWLSPQSRLNRLKRGEIVCAERIDYGQR